MRPITKAFTLTALALTLVAVPAAAETWSVDGSHTQVLFSVNHFFTPVTGSFSDFDIELDYDAENPSASSVSATIQVASIDTGNERRDGHLKSGDFFDAENHPTMTFTSSSVTGEGDSLMAHGTLTMRGTSHEIDLPITVLGVAEFPEAMQERFGKARASFKAETTIDRNDYGVGTGDWAATLVVGGDVQITILLEAKR